MRADERREFQRLLLDPPISGTLGATAVTIAEIGILGARIDHDEAALEEESDLKFTYGVEEIVMRCERARAGDKESGLRFVAAVGESGDRLRAMLGELVTKALEDRRNVAHESLGQTIDGDKTVRGKDAGYLSYRFEDGIWSRRRVFLPEQPRVGFTVARSVDSEDLQRLCRVYQASDDEGRRLIRLFAELSVSEALEIPPRV